MGSIFSFRRRPSEEQPTPLPSGEPAASLPERAGVAPAAAVHVESLDDVLDGMITALRAYLPPFVDGLPFHTVSIISLNDAPLGIGNHIGLERRTNLASVEIRGGRLDALVRFHLWGGNAGEVNNAITGLMGRLVMARDALWSAGFLRVVSEGSGAALFDLEETAWGRTADYRVLYEYTIDVTDSAQGLIARVPVHADQEVFNSPMRETSIVTGDMARWDDLSAAPLVLRGGRSISGLTALAFIPADSPGGPVTLTRTFDGAVNPPAEFATLAEFVAAAGDAAAPNRNARVVFPSLGDFLTTLGEAGAPLTLVNRDAGNRLDEYRSFGLAFAAPVVLPLFIDRFEVVYGNGEEAFDQTAVAYVRARAP